MAVSVVGAGIILSDLGNFIQMILPTPSWIMDMFTGMVGAKGDAWGSLLLIVIVAPLTEELLFRGVILRGFLKRYSVRKSVIASAILFGVFHQNPWQAVPATVLGALYGWWYVRTRSLVPCMFGHALNNAIPLLFVVVIEVGSGGGGIEPTPTTRPRDY